METQTLLWIILGALLGIIILILLLIVTIRFFLATILIKAGQKLVKNVVEDVKTEFTGTVKDLAKQGKDIAQEEIGKVKRKL